MLKIKETLEQNANFLKMFAKVEKFRQIWSHCLSVQQSSYRKKKKGLQLCECGFRKLKSKDEKSVSALLNLYSGR